MKMTLTLPTVLIAGLAASYASASSYSTDFENFALGGDTSGSNPLITDPGLVGNNWRGNGASGLANNGVPGSTYDGEIVDLGGETGRAYRLSNAVVSGNYDTTHAATPTVDLIGESSTGGTPGVFSYSFDFKSASDTFQEGLNVNATTNRSGTSIRQGILRIIDVQDLDTQGAPTANDGLTVGWFQTLSDGGFDFVELATGLSREAWHSVSIDLTFVEGLDNDSVVASVNGDTTTGLGTWETFYSEVGDPSVEAIDSVIFRVASPLDFGSNTGGVAALDGGGVFFDNLTVTAVPEPTSLALLGFAGLGMMARRRRRA